MKMNKLYKKINKNTFYVFPYEWVIHYIAVICLQNCLKLCDVIVLVGTRERKVY